MRVTTEGFTADRAALQRAIAQCLLKDQHPLRRSLKQLQGLQQQQDALPLLEKIIQRITRSQQIVAARQTPLTIRYPDELPVAGRREEILAAIRQHQRSEERRVERV